MGPEPSATALEPYPLLHMHILPRGTRALSYGLGALSTTTHASYCHVGPEPSATALEPYPLLHMHHTATWDQSPQLEPWSLIHYYTCIILPRGTRALSYGLGALSTTTHASYCHVGPEPSTTALEPYPLLHMHHTATWDQSPQLEPWSLIHYYTCTILTRGTRALSYGLGALSTTTHASYCHVGPEPSATALEPYPLLHMHHTATWDQSPQLEPWSLIHYYTCTILLHGSRALSYGLGALSTTTHAPYCHVGPEPSITALEPYPPLHMHILLHGSRALSYGLGVFSTTTHAHTAAWDQSPQLRPWSLIHHYTCTYCRVGPEPSATALESSPLQHMHILPRGTRALSYGLGAFSTTTHAHTAAWDQSPQLRPWSLLHYNTCTYCRVGPEPSATALESSPLQHMHILPRGTRALSYSLGALSTTHTYCCVGPEPSATALELFLKTATKS